MSDADGLGDEDYHDIDGNLVSLYLRRLVKSAYMEGFASSKPWRDEEAYWNTSRAKKDTEIERLRGLMINLVSSAKARPHPASEYGEVIVCGDDFNAIEKEVNDD